MTDIKNQPTENLTQDEFNPIGYNWEHTSDDRPMEFSCRVYAYGSEIARIYVRDGQLHFEGNMTESAQVFFEEYLKPLCDMYIKERL